MLSRVGSRIQHSRMHTRWTCSWRRTHRMHPTPKPPLTLTPAPPRAAGPLLQDLPPPNGRALPLTPLPTPYPSGATQSHSRTSSRVLHTQTGARERAVAWLCRVVASSRLAHTRIRTHTRVRAHTHSHTRVLAQHRVRSCTRSLRPAPRHQRRWRWRCWWW